LPEVWARTQRDPLPAPQSRFASAAKSDNGKAPRNPARRPQAATAVAIAPANRSPLVLPSLHPFSFLYAAQMPSDAAF